MPPEKPQLPQIIQLPKRRKASRNVKKCLERAVKIAEENGWKRVIIIGAGDDVHNVSNSHMDQSILVGLIEISKDIILHDNEC